MSLPDRCLIRSRGPSGEAVVRVGMPLVDDYLEVLAAAYDLRVFFTVVARAPAAVEPADVLGFITAQRTCRNGGAVLQPLDSGEQGSGVASSTVARRLSNISGFFACPQVRGDIDATRCRAVFRPDGNARVRGRGCR